jgi:hypothetical protein
MSRNPLKLDEEELQILRDFERGEFESIQHFLYNQKGQVFTFDTGLRSIRGARSKVKT